jgi:tRNA G18 (ribose-2'-O)-methylase SpoU
LDKVQNQAIRVMMGAMKSTPIVEMKKGEDSSTERAKRYKGIDTC